MVDMCVVSTPDIGPMHTCQTANCHAGRRSRQLGSLERQPHEDFKAKYLDVPNAGDGTMMPPCPLAQPKLIDSTTR